MDLSFLLVIEGDMKGEDESSSQGDWQNTLFNDPLKTRTHTHEPMIYLLPQGLSAPELAVSQFYQGPCFFFYKPQVKVKHSFTVKLFYTDHSRFTLSWIS